MNNAIKEQIEKIISENDVVLFMKGTSDFPQCGFSGLVVSVLQKLGVTFYDVNVLADDDIRQAIKDYTDWPTIPQLYVKGEFVGGCDIVKEMYQNGELIGLLQERGISCVEQIK